ncbi:glycerol-1-phosphate dehydrogenase [NAD(P)+] [Halogranum amylolyticum]|uniref:Glycerol-1-phosphate dehydrogenase [NAD(P)+] n=1 Tax=Halogranum amylolyticum TaxID=660520 RepID=A0A1H8UBX2_9EURY|nr:NAD(P)-dependent glycerol-1-phosphate dehydrogenase [Halogranum amylolyticum]SEP00596.1 glycerol-1-phosphate dehydrogenase [NAD(P)+] [Halogranum amylolyticum]
MFNAVNQTRLPREIVVGSDVLSEAVNLINGLSLRGQPLLVTSPIQQKLAAERLVDDLETANHDPITVIVEEASFNAVAEVRDTARTEDIDYLIGVGDRKVLDVAKMVSDSQGKGFVSVPTNLSHDGIASDRSLLIDGEERHSLLTKSPLAVVADTEILADASSDHMSAGYADVISNYTAVMDWRVAHRTWDVPFSKYAAALSEMTAEMVASNVDLLHQGIEQSAWIVAKALISTGVATSIAGTSRPACGAEHLFSFRLDQLAAEPALHGHQVGVGSIMTAYLHDGDRGSWTNIRNALVSIDAPTTAAELGIDDGTVIEALNSCHEIWNRYTILGDGIDEQAAWEIASHTGVIS